MPRGKLKLRVCVMHKDISENLDRFKMKLTLVLFGVASSCLAIILTLYGISVMYNDSYSRKVVGGDAYNFIIYAARGTAYVCAGAVCSILSVFFLMLAKFFTEKS